MRLIDADKVIDWIDLGHLRHPSELCFSEIDVVNMINHQPTAYDVEAVVRELESFKYTADELSIEWESGYNIGLGDAIEAVKRGGRNE